MTHKKVVDYFTNKYYELARKYRIYAKCRDNTQLTELSIRTAIECGLRSLEYETIDQISEEDLRYFLSIGDHIIEAMLIVAKRNYMLANKVAEMIKRKNGGVHDSKK